MQFKKKTSPLTDPAFGGLKIGQVKGGQHNNPDAPHQRCDLKIFDGVFTSQRIAVNAYIKPFGHYHDKVKLEKFAARVFKCSEGRIALH